MPARALHGEADPVDEPRRPLLRASPLVIALVALALAGAIVLAVLDLLWRSR